MKTHMVLSWYKRKKFERATGRKISKDTRIICALPKPVTRKIIIEKEQHHDKLAEKKR